VTDSLRVGRVEEVGRVFRQTDFDRFAAISGDDNPIHVDPVFSARTKFGRTVAHGMFLYSVVCGVLSTRLPGPGMRQVDQELLFPNPTYTGEEVTVRVEVVRAEPDAGLADLSTLVLRPDGKPGLEGRTRVRLLGAGAHIESPREGLQGLSAAATSECLKGFTIGQHAETRRGFAESDLEEYVDLTGDANPLLTDTAYARRLGFDGLLVPSGLLGGMISFLLGTRLPGQGTNYLKQRLEFPAPAYAGQELTAAVEVVRLRPEKQLVNLATTVQGPSGEMVCRGEALVLVSDVGA
jgi:acyl dehydratase